MKWIAFAASLACAAAIYWRGLHGPLVFDDLHNLAPLEGWLKGATGWQSVVFGNYSGSFGRPVAMASFVANMLVSGPDTFGLKLGNLLLHLANGALVFALFNQLVRLGSLRSESPTTKSWVPWLGATIWLLHPLFASTVLYVVQRMAILSTMFTLLAMLAYMQGRMALIDGNRIRACWLLVIGVPVATLLAAFSKENGILAPALCALLELFVFFPRQDERRSRISIVFIFTALILPALIAIILIAVQPDAIFAGYANRSFTLWDRLLTEPRVLWDYVSVLLLPSGARLGLYHDDYRISHGLLDPASTTLAIVAWLTVIAAAWRLRRTIPGFALGVGIFFVGHALESTIFPLLIYFEHRNYLPAIGAIWAVLSLLSYAAEHAARHMHQPERIFRLAALCLITALAMVTLGRASVWSQQDRILADGLRHHPGSRWLQLDLIAQAMSRQPAQLDDAVRYAETMRQSTDPSTVRLGATSRLLITCASGDAAQSELVAEAFAGRPEPLEPDLLRVIESLGDGVESHPCTGLSPQRMAESLSALLDRSARPASDFGIWRLRFKAASLYLAAGNEVAALDQAMLAEASGSADPQVAVFIADLMSRRGDLAGAGRMLDSAASRIARDDLVGQKIIAQRRDSIRKQHHRQHLTTPARPRSDE